MTAELQLDMQTIKLQTKDGVIIVADMLAAKLCGTIRNLLEELTTVDESTIIPLPLVSAPIMRMVLQYSEHHVFDPIVTAREELLGYKRDEALAEWDRQLMEVELATIYEILMAANYLNNPGVMRLASKTVADMMRDKTPSELIQIFSITQACEAPKGAEEEFGKEEV